MTYKIVAYLHSTCSIPGSSATTGDPAHVKLPTGTVTPLNVHHEMTIGDLKSAIEFSSGIPSDLMTISFGTKGILIDSQTLGQLCFIQGTRLPLRVIYGYEDLVSHTLSGNAKSVLQDIKTHHEADTVWKRQSVALFMAAHRGFFYLVEKLLSTETIPRIVDAQTPSGRTALHAACAMGNLGCVDSLLQHNAALDIRDGHGQTPAQVAFSCGQQDAERRICTYKRVRSKQKREKQQLNQSWPRSSRFPVSKLAQSTSPTLALNELIISPGPTFKITPWKCKMAKPPWALSQAVPKRPGSARSSDSSSSSKSDNDAKGQSDDDLAELALEQELNTSERSQLHPSRKEAQPQHIRFNTQTTTFNKPCAPKATALYSTDYSVEGMRRAYDQRHYGNGKPTTGILKNRIRPSSAAVTDSAMLYRQHQRENRQKARESMPPTFELTPSEVLTVASVENSNECIAEDIKLPPKVRDEVDRMRRLVDLPVEYPEEEFGVAKIFGNQRQRPGTARRRATPAENQKAYKLWLASKSQDARDRKLVNKISTMLDGAFGRTPEQFTTPISPKDDDNEKGVSFEEWIAKKHAEILKNKANQEKEQEKMRKLQLQKKEAQITERVKAIDQWVNQKLAIEKQKHIMEKQTAKQRATIKTERQLKAEAAFSNWSMQKQWKELEQFEKRPHTVTGFGRRTPQVRKSNQNRRKSMGQVTPRVRSVSQPTAQRTPFTN